MTFSEFDRPRDRSWRWLVWNVIRLFRACLRGSVGGVLRLFTTDLTAGFRKTLPLRVVFVGAALKLAWLPPAIVVACGWSVYQQTRGPAQVSAQQVARVSNAFSERVSIESSDGITLSAVWVPALRIEQIAQRGDALLDDREPAVVLVHDHGQDAGQMLAQAALLHELGMHVLVLETRGSGMSEYAPRTFGRQERLDVAAAVDYVAARPTVDPQRIAVWAVGTGVEAAKGAPTSASIALLVAETTPQGPIDDRFMPANPAYDALRPVCRWMFHVLFAGGPADTTSHPPKRVVEVRSGDLERAVQELKAFGSDHLVPTP
jgi:alpha/beta superfamily hydrolase